MYEPLRQIPLVTGSVSAIGKNLTYVKADGKTFAAVAGRNRLRLLCQCLQANLRKNKAKSEETLPTRERILLRKYRNQQSDVDKLNNKVSTMLQHRGDNTKKTDVLLTVK
uniref:Uncharacterized protein n=1 Tax=Romanomermis culicivorax TaxID=13658 RepID=A0A915HM49_ROMCU